MEGVGRTQNFSHAPIEIMSVSEHPSGCLDIKARCSGQVRPGDRDSGVMVEWQS